MKLKFFESSPIAIALGVASLLMATASNVSAQEAPRIEKSTVTVEMERATVISTGGNITAARNLFALDTGAPGIEIGKIQSCGGSVSESHVKVKMPNATVVSTGKVEIGVIKAGKC
jgi:hypothetical protein